MTTLTQLIAEYAAKGYSITYRKVVSKPTYYAEDNSGKVINLNQELKRRNKECVIS